ncbi:MAG: two-component regulator propeller domain-containing protein [Anaerolineae bacterium]|nr:two-component regulator propeller domain-containing protein [Anaerolineae bacterium]
MKPARWITLWVWIIATIYGYSDVRAAANPPPAVDLTLATVRFQTVSLAHGLSQSVVLDIVQDQRGFLWFATEDGLNHYNGYDFIVYRHDPEDATSLANNYVRALCVDQQGTLWVGTDSGLDRFDPETDSFTHFIYNPGDPQSLGGNEVNAITEDNAGYLWIGTAGGGLSRMDPTKGTFTSHRHAADVPPSLSGNNVSALTIDNNGVLWIGTNAGLDRFEPELGMFTHYHPNLDGNNAVRVIYEDKHGQLWIGMEGGGLAYLDQETLTFTNYRHQNDNPYSLSDDAVWAILEDHAGRLWIGTQNGLNRWDAERERFARVTHSARDPHSLGANTIRSIYEDRSGVVWFGTYGAGLSKLTRAADNFILYQHNPDDPNSLSENAIWSIATTVDGSVWFGTMREGLDRMNRETGTITHYKHNPDDPGSLSHNDVRILQTDHAGGLWIGTYGGGLDRFDPQTDTFTHYRHDPTDPGSLGEDQVRVLYEDHAGNLWIGTQSQGLDYFDRTAETFTHYLPDSANSNSLSGNRVRAIIEDHQGQIWLGTWNDGLNILNPDTGNIGHYRNDPADPGSLSNDTILALHEDAQGVMWIGTYGGGLARFDPATKTFHTYTQKDGLPNDGIYSILEDPHGFLWISTNKGITRFDPRTDLFHNYDVNDGLQSNEFNYGASHQSAWGEFFFAGIEGVSAFYPEHVQDNPNIPPVVITDFRKQNQSLYTNLPPDQRIALSYKDNFISFEFAALDYNAPEEQIYAYKMEGQDTNWIEAGTRRHADYTNLKGGEYVFRVTAANNDGLWNTEGTMVRISVTPPIWETWGFRSAVALLLAGVLFGGYRLRLHSEQLRSRELEEQVDKRTAEIERRREELEALYKADEQLLRHLHLDQVLQALVKIAVDILYADKSSLIVWDTAREKLIVRVAHGFNDATLAQMIFEPHEGTVGLVATTGVPIVVEDTLQDSRVAQRITQPESIRAFMHMPIKVGNEIFGVFNVDYVAPRTFGKDEQRLFSALAQRAALAIETAQLYEQTQQTAVLEERQRIARELHDSVSQALYGIALGSRTARTLVDRQPIEKEIKTTLANPLDYVLSLTEVGLAEMRALIFELRPDALEKEGLTAALTKQVEVIRVRQKLNVQTDFCSEPDLPLATKEALYRVAQEALNNLIKHASASRVDVRLRCDSDVLTLEVQDDGAGFDPQGDYPGHLGLHTMRERVTSLGGTLTIESAPGEGTTVRAYLPL